MFVPLLALGCYHVGRLAFGRTAGALAVVFALGSPLLIEQFHVLMLEARQAFMLRRRALPGAGPPCARLPNGDGVWVSVGAPSAPAPSWCANRPR